MVISACIPDARHRASSFGDGEYTAVTERTAHADPTAAAHDTRQLPSAKLGSRIPFFCHVPCMIPMLSAHNLRLQRIVDRPAIHATGSRWALKAEEHNCSKQSNLMTIRQEPCHTSGCNPPEAVHAYVEVCSQPVCHPEGHLLCAL